MEKLVAGIVGAGGIADYHIGGYLNSGVEVAGIADPDTKRAEEKAKKFGIKNVFSSYQEMIEKVPEINLVSVCVPNKFHSEISIYCLESGKNVFCEKPPALNAEETEKMKQAAEVLNLILNFRDFTFKCFPIYNFALFKSFPRFRNFLIKFRGFQITCFKKEFFIFF